MASIIRMTSKEFLKKFINEYDYKKYQFLIISEDIKSKNGYKNTFVLKSLIPPVQALSEFVANGYSDKYKKMYFSYLSMDKVEDMLTVMVKLAAIDKTNVVLLCSDKESDFKYLNLICKYLEKVYHVKTCTYKEYVKNPDECNATPNKKKVVKILKDKLPNVNPANIKTESKPDKTSIKKKLNKLSLKELKTFCKDRDIKIKKSDEKEDLIKKIMKHLFK